MPDWLYSLLQLVVNAALVAYCSRRAYGRGYDDGRSEQARLMGEIDDILRDEPRNTTA